MLVFCVIKFIVFNASSLFRMVMLLKDSGYSGDEIQKRFI